MLGCVGMYSPEEVASVKQLDLEVNPDDRRFQPLDPRHVRPIRPAFLVRCDGIQELDFDLT